MLCIFNNYFSNEILIKLFHAIESVKHRLREIQRRLRPRRRNPNHPGGMHREVGQSTNVMICRDDALKNCRQFFE